MFIRSPKTLRDKYESFINQKVEFLALESLNSYKRFKEALIFLVSGVGKQVKYC